MHRISIMIVEDQALMRAGLKTLLDLNPECTVIGEASDGVEAVAMAQTLRPNVILMDIHMPRMNGLDATTQVLAVAPESKVIILTTFDCEGFAIDGLEAGASGFLLKDTPLPELIRVIQLVHAGERFVQPSIAGRMIGDLMSGLRNEGDREALSRREREILRLMAGGMSNRAIADRLILANGTVKNYVSSILSKLRVGTREEAVAAARTRGLIGSGYAYASLL